MRKYPCQAIINNVRSSKFSGLNGKKITVLSGPQECGRFPVELPEGYPNPPAGCMTWYAEGFKLTFLPTHEEEDG